jgi:hypothetical protein
MTKMRIRMRIKDARQNPTYEKVVLLFKSSRDKWNTFLYIYNLKMLMNTLLALLAVIVVAIAASMFLDDSVLSYLRQNDVPIIDTTEPKLEFFMNTQISDDIPNHY